jgi:hypothetical protein
MYSLYIIIAVAAAAAATTTTTNNNKTVSMWAYMTNDFYSASIDFTEVWFKKYGK